MEKTVMCLNSIHAFIIMICGAATGRRLFEKVSYGFDETFAIERVTLVSKTECLLKCKVQPACQDIAWVSIGESYAICTLLRSGSVLSLGGTTAYKSIEVDGQWTPWSKYSPCSRTCGGGLHLRTRTCTNPSPMYGGVDCHGDSATTLVCNQQPCPAHVQLTGISPIVKNNDWVRVLVIPSSNSNSFQTCKNTTNCQRESTDWLSRVCGNDLIDGNWSQWSEYGTCTASCGGGHQIRTRTCTNPKPQYRGRACSGGTTSSRSCNSHICIDCTGLDGVWPEDEAIIKFISPRNFTGRFKNSRPDFYGNVVEGPCKGAATFPDDATFSFEYVKEACTLYYDDRNPLLTWTRSTCTIPHKVKT